MARLFLYNPVLLYLGRKHNGTAILEISSAILRKLNIQLQFDTEISCLGIFYPWETEMYVYSKTMSQLFVSSLFLKTQMFFNQLMDKQLYNFTAEY